MVTIQNNQVILQDNKENMSGYITLSGKTLTLTSYQNNISKGDIGFETYSYNSSKLKFEKDPLAGRHNNGVFYPVSSVASSDNNIILCGGRSNEGGKDGAAGYNFLYRAKTWINNSSPSGLGNSDGFNFSKSDDNTITTGLDITRDGGQAVFLQYTTTGTSQYHFYSLNSIGHKNGKTQWDYPDTVSPNIPQVTPSGNGVITRDDPAVDIDTYGTESKLFFNRDKQPYMTRTGSPNDTVGIAGSVFQYNFGSFNKNTHLEFNNGNSVSTVVSGCGKGTKIIMADNKNYIGVWDLFQDNSNNNNNIVNGHRLELPDGDSIDGAVRSYEITNTGSGYSVGEDINLTNSGTPGDSFQIKVTSVDSKGAVTGYYVTQFGSNYDTEDIGTVFDGIGGNGSNFKMRVLGIGTKYTVVIDDFYHIYAVKQVMGDPSATPVYAYQWIYNQKSRTWGNTQTKSGTLTTCTYSKRFSSPAAGKLNGGVYNANTIFGTSLDVSNGTLCVSMQNITKGTTNNYSAICVYDVTSSN